MLTKPTTRRSAVKKNIQRPNLIKRSKRQWDEVILSSSLIEAFSMSYDNTIIIDNVVLSRKMLPCIET